MLQHCSSNLDSADKRRIGIISANPPSFPFSQQLINYLTITYNPTLKYSSRQVLEAVSPVDLNKIYIDGINHLQLLPNVGPGPTFGNNNQGLMKV